MTVAVGTGGGANDDDSPELSTTARQGDTVTMNAFPKAPPGVTLQEAALSHVLTCRKNARETTSNVPGLGCRVGNVNETVDELNVRLCLSMVNARPSL